jgi:Fe-S cluster assembly protein SufD
MITEIVSFATTNSVTLSPVEDTLYLVNCASRVGKVPEASNTLVVTLAHPDVTCHIYCGYKVERGDAVNLATTIIHTAARTSSTTIIRGVLFAGGVSNYVGRIVMNHAAQGSSARLDDKTLVVGEGTRNHAEPSMQIEANEVTASHASSTGPVDGAQLYYLQSRGLSHAEAQTVLVDAFLTLPKV